MQDKNKLHVQKPATWMKWKDMTSYSNATNQLIMEEKF